MTKQNYLVMSTRQLHPLSKVNCDISRHIRRPPCGQCKADEEQGGQQSLPPGRPSLPSPLLVHPLLHPNPPISTPLSHSFWSFRPTVQEVRVVMTS